MKKGEYLVVAAVGGAAIFLSACNNPYKEEREKVDASKQIAAGRQVEQAMFEKAGMSQWMELLPFESLTENQRAALRQTEKKKGIFDIAKTQDGVKIGVVYNAGYPNHPYAYEINTPTKVKVVIDENVKQPSISFEWDLSRFLTLDESYAKPENAHNPYRLTVDSDNPPDYLNANGAIKAVVFRGSKEALSPLTQILETAK